jgi:isoleucyl-tRNA synthetase
MQLNIDKTYCSYENEISALWKEHELYKNLQEKEKQSSSEFRFMDGPPFVSGSLHMGHLLVSSLKSSYLNFMRMHNFKCDNKLGYDCHGLPIESVVCKKLNVFTKSEIEKLSIEKFNGTCKKLIQEYSHSWEPLFDSIGRWADFQHTYKTMDVEFMETVWWIFSEMWKRKLIYKGCKVMPYSYGCQTPLSNFEATLNYKEITTRTVYVYFPLADDPNTGFVVWTTTPWTLPSNVAICVNPNITYVICTDESNKKYILSESTVHNVKIKFTKVEFYHKGSELVGMKYVSPFDFIKTKFYKVIQDNYVEDNPDIGTGIVHIAPAFGEDDFRVCQNILSFDEIRSTCLVDDEGNSIIYKKNVFDCDKDIVKFLKEKNILVHEQSYNHSYPFCYRTDTPLIYRVVDSFFVEVTKFKDKLIEMNKKINWYPEFIGDKRFNNWLENIKDWGISRSRYFGTPIPVWMSSDGDMITVSSIDELVKLANLSERPIDLHREFIDKITITINDKVYSRVSDVFDCWFESGSVPYGQIHYPFENSHAFDDREFLSDFITEGLDQTRGWFYTLLVIATAISQKPPFKNVICTGLILDSKGVKLSKKYGNFVDPSELITKYGADILRVYLLSSVAVNADSLLFKESEIVRLKQKIIPYINAVKFLLEFYINFRKSHDQKIGFVETSSNLTDKWILEKTCDLRVNTEQMMFKFDISGAVSEIINYIEDLTNWYLKLNRDRFKGSYGIDEQITSLSVLYTVIYEYNLITAPFMPFLSEYIYQHIKKISNETTDFVHKLSYPTSSRNFDISKVFSRVQCMAHIIRTIRDESSTHKSVKIPIKSCVIMNSKKIILEDMSKIVELIQEEVNVLEFKYEVTRDDAIKYVVKPNMKVMGKKYRKNISDKIKFIESLTFDVLKQFYEKKITSYLDISCEDFEITKITTSDDKLQIKEFEDCIVKVDLTYDEDIHNKFQMRKLTCDIQQTRKFLDLHPWNKIKVYLNSDDIFVSNILLRYKVLISDKIGSEIFIDDLVKSDYSKEFNFVDFNDKESMIKLGIVYC